MRPVDRTLINTVRSPIEPVFALLTDLGRIAAWLPGCTGVQCEGALKKGVRVQVRFGARATEFEIVDFVPPHTFGWVERGQRRGWKTLVRLDAAGESTAITIRAVWVPPSLGAWFRGRFLQKRNVQGQLNTIVQNLQAALRR